MFLVSIFLFLVLVALSKSCSMFSSLNCSCFQSDDVDLSISTDLFCEGHFSSRRPLDFPLGNDFSRHAGFRTVTLEFSLDGHFEVFSGQFSNLSGLFFSTPLEIPVEISLRFNGFTALILHPRSLTTNIVHSTHFQLSFLPSRPDNSIRVRRKDQLEMEEQEEDQLQFSANTFSGLNVSELSVSIYSIHDRLSRSIPFESIFNGSFIGHLHLHGSLIPPNGSLIQSGLIRSLTVHRRVDTIDSTSFPPYPSVISYRIASVDGHSMDLSTFVVGFPNLRGLELVNPRFSVSIDSYLPRLEWLTLDVEHLTDRTFLFARHIEYLRLGSRLRRISSQVFFTFPPRLKHFDLSQVDLAELTPESLCSLLHFLSHISRREGTLFFPRTSSLNECDCARLFVHFLRNPKSKIQREDRSCSKQCRFNDCPTLSEFFRKKFPLVPQEEQQTEKKNDDGFFVVDLDDDGPSSGFLNNPTELPNVRLTTSFEDQMEKWWSLSGQWFLLLIGLSFALLCIFLLILFLIFRAVKCRDRDHQHPDCHFVGVGLLEK